MNQEDTNRNLYCNLLHFKCYKNVNSINRLLPQYGSQNPQIHVNNNAAQYSKTTNLGCKINDYAIYNNRNLYGYQNFMITSPYHYSKKVMDYTFENVINRELYILNAEMEQREKNSIRKQMLNEKVEGGKSEEVDSTSVECVVLDGDSTSVSQNYNDYNFDNNKFMFESYHSSSINEKNLDYGDLILISQSENSLPSAFYKKTKKGYNEFKKKVHFHDCHFNIDEDDQYGQESQNTSNDNLPNDQNMTLKSDETIRLNENYPILKHGTTNKRQGFFNVIKCIRENCK